MCHHLSCATWRNHCSGTVTGPPPEHRSTTVNSDDQRWSTTVNGGGERWSPTVNGGGQWWQTTVDHRRSTVVDRQSTGGSWTGSGRVGSGRHVACHVDPRVSHVDADVT
ncbi:hypothetical protein Tco_0900284 [Tanacetum coccineum]